MLRRASVSIKRAASDERLTNWGPYQLGKVVSLNIIPLTYMHGTVRKCMFNSRPLQTMHAVQCANQIALPQHHYSVCGCAHAYAEGCTSTMCSPV